MKIEKRLGLEGSVIKKTMSSFLKLTKRIINTRYISRIDIEPTGYKIKLMTNEIYGVWVCGGGALGSIKSDINLCKTKDKMDYEIVTQWLKGWK
jgi:hypothetical protein